MSSTLKRVIAIVIVVVIIGLIAYFKIQEKRVYYNDGAVNGNSVSNLYGKGLFCEKNGLVYFANPNDDNTLYTMKPDESEVKKLCDDRVYYINVDDHYVYYSRDNNNDESDMAFLNVNVNSLCRLTTDGKKIKILDDDICSTLALSGNTLFYHHYDKKDATTLYSIGIDGSNKAQVFDNSTDPRCLIEDELYYSGVESDHNIHLYNVNQGSSAVVSMEWAWMPVVEGNKLYFLDLNDSYKIACVDLNSGEKTSISQFGATEYNVVDNIIFYQSLKADTDGIYRIDLSSNTEAMVIAGQYNSINTTSQYVYFKDYYSDAVYHTRINGQSAVVFSPLVEIDKK